MDINGKWGRDAVKKTCVDSDVLAGWSPPSRKPKKRLGNAMCESCGRSTKRRTSKANVSLLSGSKVSRMRGDAIERRLQILYEQWNVSGGLRSAQNLKTPKI